LCIDEVDSEGCKRGESMAPKKAKAKKKSTGDDKGDEKVGHGRRRESKKDRT